MGQYCHISLVMACDGYDGIADLAAEHAERLEPRKGEDSYLEAWQMLVYLAERKGVSISTKGGLFTWGVVGNYTRGEVFVEALMPFLTDLWKANPSRDGHDGPLHFEHVLVFFEREQAERANAYEISFDEDTQEIAVKHHDCPFAWMQF